MILVIKNRPKIVNKTKGLQTAKDGDINPLDPNCSRTLVTPINTNQKATAYPNVTTVPFLLNDKANGAVKRVMMNGRKAVEYFFWSDIK